MLSIKPYRFLIYTYLFVFLTIHFVSKPSFTQDYDSLLRNLDKSSGDQKVEILLSLAEATDSLSLSMEYTDAALLEIQKSENKAFLAEAYYLKGKNYKSMHDVDSADLYLKKAVKLAMEINDSKILGSAYFLLGVVCELKSDYDSCMIYYHKAVQAIEGKEHHKIYSEILIDMGYIYDFWGNRDSALICMQQAFTAADEVHYQKGVARASVAMGNIYFAINDLEKALDFYHKAYEIAKELGNKMGMGASMTNMGAVYSELENYEQSVEAYKEAIEILKTTHENSLLANAYSNLAIVLAEQGEYSLAMEYLEKGIYLIRKSGNKEDIAISLFTHSRVYQKAGLYRKSNLYVDSCLQTALEINFNLMEQECYKTYAENYIELKEFERAVFYQDKHYHLKDSLATKKFKDQLMQFENKYKNEQNLREIENLQRDNQLRKQERNSFIIGFILVLLLVFILLRNFRIKNQSNKLLEEKNILLEKLTKDQQELLYMKDKLFSIIGHDLKNPFNSIMGLSDLLYNQYHDFDEKDKIEIAENINNVSIETYRLLENLLEWAKTQSGKIEFSPQTTPLKEAVEESIASLKSSAEHKHIDLEIRITEEMNIFADKNMLLTIIRNLCSNAIKFSQEGKKVIIKAVSKDQFIEVQVIDEGTGIPPDKISSLFQSGKSYKMPGTANEKGSGLGLLICKEFVEFHQGQINVESEPGKGSIFSFSIPQKI